MKSATSLAVLLALAFVSASAEQQQQQQQQQQQPSQQQLSDTVNKLTSDIITGATHGTFNGIHNAARRVGLVGDSNGFGAPSNGQFPYLGLSQGENGQSMWMAPGMGAMPHQQGFGGGVGQFNGMSQFNPNMMRGMGRPQLMMMMQQMWQQIQTLRMQLQQTMMQQGQQMHQPQNMTPNTYDQMNQNPNMMNQNSNMMNQNPNMMNQNPNMMNQNPNMMNQNHPNGFNQNPAMMNQNHPNAFNQAHGQHMNPMGNNQMGFNHGQSQLPGNVLGKSVV